MPPRRQRDIVSNPYRRDQLRRFSITEKDLEQLLELGLEEARWRIAHEHQVHLDWLKERRRFLEGEVASFFGKPAPKPKGPSRPDGGVVHPHQLAPRGQRLT